MTGAILRRLREAAGIPRKALVAHGAQAAMVASLEDCGVSRAKPEHWERKRASWCRYLDALRAAKKGADYRQIGDVSRERIRGASATFSAKYRAAESD